MKVNLEITIPLLFNFFINPKKLPARFAFFINPNKYVFLQKYTYAVWKTVTEMSNQFQKICFCAHYQQVRLDSVYKFKAKVTVKCQFSYWENQPIIWDMLTFPVENWHEKKVLFAMLLTTTVRVSNRIEWTKSVNWKFVWYFLYICFETKKMIQLRTYILVRLSNKPYGNEVTLRE